MGVRAELTCAVVSASVLVGASSAQPPVDTVREAAAIVVVGSTAAPATAATAAIFHRLVEVAAPAKLYGVVDGSIGFLGSPSVDAPTDLLTTRATRSQNGVSLDLGEAADIVRGNEAVRDQVVGRECGRNASCGGRVIATASRMLQDVERDTQLQLAALARLPWSRGAVSALVLVTAGLPYRDRPEAAIDRAAAALSAVGAPVFVVRVSGARGFLRDAWDDLLPRAGDVRAVDVSNDRDAQMLASAVGARRAAVPATPTEPADRSAALPVESAALALPPVAANAALLARAAAFVNDFERTFAAVTWHEVYTQEDHVALRFGASGGTFNTLRQRRQLESELLFVWVPSEATWIAVRDVVSVDGTPRRADERRLPALLGSGPVTLMQLRTLAAENGRFNIGAVLRTFNEPTLALLFADDRYRPRFRFSRAAASEVDGVAAATVGFVEVQRPTVIRDGVRDVPVSGQLVLDPTNGRVLRTRLEIADDRAHIRGALDVTYRFNGALGTMAPSEMRESYHGPDREEITCTAVYSDFRRFQTSGRIIIPK